jgi:hypothetical protein
MSAWKVIVPWGNERRDDGGEGEGRGEEGGRRVEECTERARSMCEG